MAAVLPDFLDYRTADDLIRLGRAHDGGYLVSAADVEATDVLVGLGINDDWSFESDFATTRAVPVVAYDGSVGRGYFLRRALTSCLNPWTFMYWTKVLVAHRRFFSGERQHVRKFVGAHDGPETVSLRRVLDKAPTGTVFLKVDIEGSEYEILDDVVAAAERTSGLVVELHDCHRHLDEIRAFVGAYPLRLVHAHANNFVPADPATLVAPVLELTFSSKASRLPCRVHPHPLDMPNDARSPDLELVLG